MGLHDTGTEITGCRYIRYRTYLSNLFKLRRPTGFDPVILSLLIFVLAFIFAWSRLPGHISVSSFRCVLFSISIGMESESESVQSVTDWAEVDRGNRPISTQFIFVL